MRLEELKLFVFLWEEYHCARFGVLCSIELLIVK